MERSPAGSSSGPPEPLFLLPHPFQGLFPAPRTGCAAPEYDLAHRVGADLHPHVETENRNAQHPLSYRKFFRGAADLLPGRKHLRYRKQYHRSAAGTVNLSVVGILLGAFITIIAAQQGINLSSTGQAYESLGYDPLVYPVFKISMAATVTIMVMFTGFLGSLYPAGKALKLKPADAIRIDM